MIPNLEIENFRGIKKLSLSNLSRVNIITGDNNSGKTSFLESLMILSKSSSITDVLRVLRVRENKGVVRPFYSNYDDFKLLEYMFNINQKRDNLKIKIEASDKDKKFLFELNGKMEKVFVDSETVNKYLKKNNKLWELIESDKESLIIDEETLNFEGNYKYIVNKDKKKNEQLELFEDPPNLIKNEKISVNKYNIGNLFDSNKSPYKTLKYHFISSIDHILKNDMEFIFKFESFKTEVVDLLKIFDAGIEDILIIKENNNYINCIKSKEKGILPIGLYGDGIKKVIILADGLVRAKDGILLIDEIETSIHRRVMKNIFGWLLKAAKQYNVQLFITTHSLEVVDEFLNTDIKEFVDETRVITIHNTNKDTVARVLKGNEALKLRENFNMELRK